MGQLGRNGCWRCGLIFISLWHSLLFEGRLIIKNLGNHCYPDSSFLLFFTLVGNAFSSKYLNGMTWPASHATILFCKLFCEKKSEVFTKDNSSKETPTYPSSRSNNHQGLTLFPYPFSPLNLKQSQTMSFPLCTLVYISKMYTLVFTTPD